MALSVIERKYLGVLVAAGGSLYPHEFRSRYEDTFYEPLPPIEPPLSGKQTVAVVNIQNAFNWLQQAGLVDFRHEPVSGSKVIYLTEEGKRMVAG